jgi:hypothetical protein
MPDPLTCNASL